MNILMFIVTYWDVLITLGILTIGTFIKLKKLWKGNFIQWLIAICDEMEKQFGGGAGILKHANAYAKFVEKYPIISKFISQETFDKWVKEALEELDMIEDKKEELPKVEIPKNQIIKEEKIEPSIPVKKEKEDNETLIEIKEKSLNIALPKSEVPLLKLEKIDATKVNKLKVSSPKNANLELAINFNKAEVEKEECDIQISSKL